MGKHITFVEKSLEELKGINDKNLLAYYKAERKRFYKMEHASRCHCECGELIWEVNHGFERERKNYDMRGNYLNIVRDELNIREHVEKN